MFIARRPPPLPPQSSISRVFARNSSAAYLRAARRRGTLPPGKRGPAKGKFRDPEDPSKFISRAKVINFRPRGPTLVRSADKTESDASGKMVHDDVTVDITGVPDKIPELRYRRVPLIRAEEGTYLDWKRRKGSPKKLLEGVKVEVDMLALEVGRIAWERNLRAQPPLSQDVLVMNKRIVDILKELRDRAMQTGAPFKARSYEVAIRSIESHHSPITNGKEMMAFPGIGKKTADKIQEIIDTGTLKRLQDDTEDKRDAARNLLRRVHGIGHLAAEEFVDRMEIPDLTNTGGIMTLEQLKADKNLTSRQILGLKYFDDLETKIPREEMEIWNTTIHAAVDMVDVDFQVALVGNYRRGVSESDTIEVLVTHPSYTEHNSSESPLLQNIIVKLQSSGYITDHLDNTSPEYHGIAQLPATIFEETEIPQPPHRHIIIRLVPWDTFTFAQLHYTGSESFIRHVRQQAARLGYTLTLEKLEKHQKIILEVFGVDGLKYLQQDKNDTKKDGERIFMDSEEDIFRFIKMRYFAPHERNWY